MKRVTSVEQGREPGSPRRHSQPSIGVPDSSEPETQELGEGDRGWILNGLRGVGKTVLLNELERVAHRGWIAAKVEAGARESLSVALNQSLFSALRTATGRHSEGRLRRLLGVFKAFSLRVDPSGNVSLGVEVATLGSARSLSSMSCRRQRHTSSPRSTPRRITSVKAPCRYRS
jgi:hypothetical protein